MHGAPMNSPGIDSEASRSGVVRQIFTTPWLCIALILSGLFVLGMMALAVHSEKGFLAMWEKQHELARLESGTGDVEADNAKLRREIWRLRNDLEYIEKIAREELRLVRPGEVVFEFADDPR
ncbi:MAG: septum formation initiator family protein [Candidatus Tectomicrobia bacterium]|nr:septum formation initiator family protein [Candidatus Tectomicrobia bacterium]